MTRDVCARTRLPAGDRMSPEAVGAVAAAVTGSAAPGALTQPAAASTAPARTGAAITAAESGPPSTAARWNSRRS